MSNDSGFGEELDAVSEKVVVVSFWRRVTIFFAVLPISILGIVVQ